MHRLQVIHFEIDCAIFYTNLHELFFQFISWTNWVNSGKYMDNCWISCQVIADIKKVYNNLIIFNLLLLIFCLSFASIRFSFWVDMDQLVYVMLVLKKAHFPMRHPIVQKYVYTINKSSCFQQYFIVGRKRKQHSFLLNLFERL